MQVKDETSDEGRPTSLVACANAASRFTVKILVERQEVTPMRIGLLHIILSKHGPITIGVAVKDADEPARNFIRHLAEVHEYARAGGALSF